MASLESVAGSSSGERQEKDSEKSSLEAFYQSKTKAEITFLKRKEERDAERVRKKATLTHKEKVNKFNTYLSTLSEHYDIPKVSWTK
jgi:protein FAM32A